MASVKTFWERISPSTEPGRIAGAPEIIAIEATINLWAESHKVTVVAASLSAFQVPGGHSLLVAIVTFEK